MRLYGLPLGVVGDEPLGVFQRRHPSGLAGLLPVLVPHEMRGLVCNAATDVAVDGAFRLPIKVTPPALDDLGTPGIRLGMHHVDPESQIQPVKIFDVRLPFKKPIFERLPVVQEDTAGFLAQLNDGAI